MEEKEPVKEVNISYDSKELSKNAWMDAIQELSGQPTGRPKTPPPSDIRTPSTNVPGWDDTPQEPKRRVASEELLLEQSLEKARNAFNGLNEFTRAHPYLIAPNIYRMWEDSLKESVVVLERELEKYRRNRQG